MNQTFDISRFLQLLRAEFLTNKGTVGKIFLALSLSMLLVYYIWTFLVKVDAGWLALLQITAGGFGVIASFYNPILLFVIFLVPLFMYYNLYDKVKSVNFFMLPASSLEKFLSAILQVSILLPLLLTILFSIFMFVFHAISFGMLEAEWGKLLPDFFEDTLNIIPIQSFLVLGVFWFKENKIRKIILSLIAIVVLLSVVGYLYTETDSIVYNFFNNIFNNDFGRFLYDNWRSIHWLLFPLIPWIISYQKFVKTQI